MGVTLSPAPHGKQPRLSGSSHSCGPGFVPQSLMVPFGAVAVVTFLILLQRLLVFTSTSPSPLPSVEAQRLLSPLFGPYTFDLS